jgi:dolichyl-diphosphooligosaccharide--protein glycosyltransferase
MPMIANQTFTNISGDMYVRAPHGQIVGPGMTPNMTKSMMFRFCYCNFERFRCHPMLSLGADILRRVVVPNLDIKLHNFEEVFTTKHWIVRIQRISQTRSGIGCTKHMAVAFCPLTRTVRESLEFQRGEKREVT